MLKTDLALEAVDQQKIDGIDVESERRGDVTVTRVRVTNEMGAQAIGKGVGTYVTVEVPPLNTASGAYEEQAIAALSNELKKLAPNGSLKNVMVVGLGNARLSADSLGPQVVERLIITRHIDEQPTEIKGKLSSLCAISPGVLAMTGIETSETVAGVTERVKPGLVIAVDSLASRSLERIMTTVQLSDAGIAPGSGIGNKRRALNRETLGIPVIAVGVPLVVYAGTVATDLLERSGGANSELIAKVATVNGSEMVVCPKEIDFVVDICAKLIAGSINSAVHGMDTEEAQKYMS